MLLLLSSTTTSPTRKNKRKEVSRQSRQFTKKNQDGSVVAFAWGSRMEKKERVYVCRKRKRERERENRYVYLCRDSMVICMPKERVGIYMPRVCMGICMP